MRVRVGRRQGRACGLCGLLRRRRRGIRAAREDGCARYDSADVHAEPRIPLRHRGKRRASGFRTPSTPARPLHGDGKGNGVWCLATRTWIRGWGPGKAGASARAEYERRKERDDARRRLRFGRLAPLARVLAGPKAASWSRVRARSAPHSAQRVPYPPRTEKPSPRGSPMPFLRTGGEGTGPGTRPPPPPRSSRS